MREPISKEAIREHLLKLGFARFGVARAEAIERGPLERFLDEGRHADMTWMEDTKEVRLNPSHPGMVEGAISVIVVALPYAKGRSEPPRLGPYKVARYAAGRDYHNVIRKRLRKVEKRIREAGFEARHSVDTRPVMEREWAQRAGVGFVGKNCCLIVPGVGSHVFLGTIVTTLKLEPDLPMASRCGDCTLCLTNCPTEAFVGPNELDARDCISYLTIESDAPIPEKHVPRLEGWIFGCDACQDVCPYNRTKRGPEPDPAFAQHARFDVPLERILKMSEEEFLGWSEGSPLRRAGGVKLKRNIAAAADSIRENR